MDQGPWSWSRWWSLAVSLAPVVTTLVPGETTLAASVEETRLEVQVIPGGWSWWIWAGVTGPQQIF